MRTTWLHVSDFHIRSGDHYDRDVVLRALIASVKEQRDGDRAPDLVFATGDVASSGKAAEYDLATPFFDDLLDAAGLSREHLFVIPGNHDVDRDQGIGLARTLETRDQADAYFGHDVPKPHISQKLGAFGRWYNRYFEGIRTFAASSTCCQVEVMRVGNHRLAVLPLNSALFCQDDSDHHKLLIGRRALDPALKEMASSNADLRIALVHHPLEWLSDVERSSVKASLHGAVDALLLGHLHETDVETVVATSGGTIHLAAGAAYQTRKWPNCAMYVTFDGDKLRVFPIRYEDSPTEVWTLDPSVFPREPGYAKSLTIPRVPAPVRAVPAELPEPASTRRFRSNIPSLGDVPFVGRDRDLERVSAALADRGQERVLLLHGPPGVGKSELAREFARRHPDRYPGGTFFIDCGGGAELVDLARIGANVLGLVFPPDLSLMDQCERTLLSLGDEPVLLIYDNPPSGEAIQHWLPASGVPQHVLVTSVNEQLIAGWPRVAVEPLDKDQALELVTRVAGGEAAARHGESLVAMAGGLPVQLVPASRALAYEGRRGRLESATLDLVSEAQGSFHLVYETLESPVRLLLHAAAFLANQRISRSELFGHLETLGSWTQTLFDRRLDVCLDLHLLDGDETLRMHQLFASFLMAIEVPGLDG